MYLYSSIDDIQFQEEFSTSSDFVASTTTSLSDDVSLDNHVTAEDHKQHKIWSLEFYKYYFNVTTTQIFDRFISVLMLKPFLRSDSIRTDMYGPFWITTSLIVLTAITGNFAQFLKHNDKNQEEWKYDMEIKAESEKKK